MIGLSISNHNSRLNEIATLSDFVSRSCQDDTAQIIYVNQFMDKRQNIHLFAGVH